MNVRALLLVFLFGMCPLTEAEHTGIEVAATTEQRLIIHNLNLSGKRFLSAYMSQDVQQRQLAEMYLAGVFDTGEGRTWCGYGVALPHSLQELIYVGLKKQTEKSLERRAADVINDVLAAGLPCGDKK